MPIIPSTYPGPPAFLINGHLETIIPSLFRKVEGVNYQRQKIDTPDGDFLNLDWSKVGSSKLLIISHGLEGDSERHYARGLVKLFNQNQIDVLVWNNRTCGGEINNLPILYHHGASYDLEAVVDFVLKNDDYQEIYLSGISMGGAQTLKYLGEKGERISEKIKKAAVYSTPCNLPSSAATLKLKSNIFYKKRFLGKLKKKMALKAVQFPELVDLNLLESVEDFDAFDTQFTAKIHGFKDASDFYQTVSADNWMEDIHVPTLIINALNDPLLGPECYPIELAERKSQIYLEMPKRGGHTGFAWRGHEFTWAEYRLLEFLTSEN
ncbi:YheT family hydrolase [Algoriphagus machipongonensis]|uniref:Alpha/beta fold family hydrolase n=1 Tax=Algoriphagus machipongonensis TaxID=388413 RepID=A3HT61_9BACT|nr:alpha/beta fold hydrolase [Algoriphagus machipongonensis]EAZ83029.1 alpha/beta fold family hydrolase [Algoriphagus machipongonensis]